VFISVNNIIGDFDCFVNGFFVKSCNIKGSNYKLISLQPRLLFIGVVIQCGQIKIMKRQGGSDNGN